MLKAVSKQSPLFYLGLVLVAVSVSGTVWVSSRMDNWKTARYQRGQLAKTDSLLMEELKDDAEGVTWMREVWTKHLEEEDARAQIDMPVMVGSGVALIGGLLCIKKGIRTTA